MADRWLQDKTTMLFIGDSITDCGRRGAEAPLGAGYVRSFTELATAAYPARDIGYINKGIGGHKVTDLAARWRDDVLYHRPDNLSIKIGINDLHSHLNGNDGGVDPATFETVYDDLLAQTQQELGCPIVLLTPFYISTDAGGRSWRSRVLELLPTYIKIVEDLSAKHETLLVNLHDLFQEHLRYRDAETFCPEPVHPNRTGHLIIAQALLAALP